MDWRIVLGLSVTVLWIGAGLFYLSFVVGSGNFVHLPTADIGSFLEGAFAPLAFLWLVIGHFMQQKEISSNTRAIKLQEQSARRLELHSRQDSYFKLLNLVQNQLGAIAAFHYMSIAGPTGTGEISGEEFVEQRAISSTGHHGWFIHKMLGLTLGELRNQKHLDDIARLAKLARRLGALVNILPLHPGGSPDLTPTAAADIRRFADRLRNQGIEATVRRSRGLDINAACGQLKVEVERKRRARAERA